MNRIVQLREYLKYTGCCYDVGEAVLHQRWRPSDKHLSILIHFRSSINNKTVNDRVYKVDRCVLTYQSNSIEFDGFKIY